MPWYVQRSLAKKLPVRGSAHGKRRGSARGRANLQSEVDRGKGSLALCATRQAWICAQHDVAKSFLRVELRVSKGDQHAVIRPGWRRALRTAKANRSIRRRRRQAIWAEPKLFEPSLSCFQSSLNCFELTSSNFEPNSSPFLANFESFSSRVQVIFGPSLSPFLAEFKPFLACFLAELSHFEPELSRTVVLHMWF